jgi:nucleoside-diphosphate-sugar epimerase
VWSGGLIMRIFVTGASGFIGSHFVNHALRSGHEVVAHRRSPDSTPRISLTAEPEWISKSLENIAEADLDGVDCLIHLAAAGISPRTAPWDELLKANVASPARLLQVALRAGVRRWIVTGTFAEYGASGRRYQSIPVDATLEPTFPYAASKAAGYLVFRTMAIENAAQLTYLRLFSVFGEGQHETNLWPMLRKAARAGENLPLTPGGQIRDFISVEQVADELLQSVVNRSVKPGVPLVKNVGSGRPQTVREFAETWWRRWEAPGRLEFGALPYRDGEVMRYVPEL